MKITRSVPLFLLLSLLPETLLSQLPYNQQNSVPAFHIRRTYEYRENATLNGAMIPVATSGTNVTWDLSAHALSSPVIYDTYFEPASATPFHSTWPGANIAVREGAEPGLIYYTYFNNSPFELRLLGGVTASGGQPTTQPLCPNPFLIMDYPMGLGSGVQQVYNCSPPPNDVDNWQIMATGNVIFAGGSINELVMWRSIYATSQGFTDTSFFWTQKDNVLFPVVSYNPGVRLRVWKPIWDQVIGVQELDPMSRFFSIAPNPALNELFIDLDETQDDPLHVVVRDALGREVLDLGSIPQGTTRSSHHVGTLAAGTYVIELRGREGLAGRKSFMKQ